MGQRVGTVAEGELLTAINTETGKIMEGLALRVGDVVRMMVTGAQGRLVGYLSLTRRHIR